MKNRKYSITIAPNKIFCTKCKVKIESKHRHDFVWCNCKSIAIDGGLDYCKLTGSPEHMKPVLEIKRRSVDA